jgi:exopolysaccharide biosynthesis polyprenyl glycosylphosphotransferase
MYRRDYFKLNFLYKWFSVTMVGKILHLGLRVLDLITILISAFISLFAISWYSGAKVSFHASLIFMAVVLITWAYLLELSYLPKVPRTTRYRSIFLEFSVLNIISLIVLILVNFIFRLPGVTIAHFILFIFINQLLLFLVRLACYVFYKRYRSKGYDLHNVMVIADQFSDEIIDKLINNKEWGYRVLIIVTNSKLIRVKYWDKAKIIPYKESIKKIITSDIIDEVIYCSSDLDKDMLEELIGFCREVGVMFTLNSNFSPLDPAKLQLEAMYNPGSLAFSYMPTNYFSLLLKSLTDLVFASIVLLILSPLFLFIGILIKTDSKGPVFFKQQRIGLRGRKFYCYKYRTMVQNAEALRKDLENLNEADGPVFKIKRDPRITRVGAFLRKTGLDELPQFYNVLRGEMSIMGPRPPLESEIVKYEPWQLRRLSVKPGITCLWQVAPNRNSIKFDHWVNMDLKYIDNWSLKQDFILFFKTIYSMFSRQGS